MDNDILEHLKTDFPEFDASVTINEDELKSKANKERWRKFMMAYEKKIDDYNFGTMLRTNPKFEYDQDTTIFGMITFGISLWVGKESTWTDNASFPSLLVPRMQFYAVEIARNRAGLNDWIYEKAQAEKNKK